MGGETRAGVPLTRLDGDFEMGKHVTMMLLLHWLTQYLQCGHTQGTGQSPWEMWPSLGSQELRHYQETIPPPSEPSSDPERSSQNLDLVGTVTF